MKVSLYEKPKFEWQVRLPATKEHPRHWITIIDLEIELSDGYVLKRPSGTIWDGASIPKSIWWLFKPVDEGSIGDFIHDCLWIDKLIHIERYEGNIFKTRLYSDNERNNWRKKLVPKLWFKNYTTHFVIRKIGGFYYSRQIEIPK